MAEARRTLPPFAAIEHEIIDDERLTGNDLLVYLAICRHVDATRTGWPSKKRLAHLSRLSVPTVRRCLRHLEQAGWLTCKSRYRKNGTQASNLYIVGKLVTEGFTGDPPPRDSSRPPSELEPDTNEKQSGNTLPPPTPASADADVISPPERFSAWWAIYPRRVGKKAAERKYRTALGEGATVEQLLEGARRMRAKADAGTALKYIPHPATWLNQGRWEDEEGGDEAWKENLTEWERDALL